MDECDNLKQFIIPKRRTSASEALVAVDPNSIEYKNDILEVIQLHFKHKDSLSSFTFDGPHFVQNPVLLTEFNEKRKHMKEICNDKELKCTYAFLHLSSKFEAESICREGLHVGNCEMKSLGDPLLGVYVCKYPDVFPPSMSFRTSNGYLLIFKFIKGKVKTMVENKTGDALEPTPGWDCHIAKSSLQSDASEFESSQIYVYEYDNNMEVLERPRHLLPFALVSFKIVPKKLQPSKFQQANLSKRNAIHKSSWMQPYLMDSDAILPDLSKKNSIHTITFHQRQPYLLWSGSMIVSNRIICSVNIYSDSFVTCPFYLGPDIKLNSEFKTEKLFSHFFLDKLPQLNKKEFTVWNSIYYTYVKLKCTESMVFKFLKVANYLQDKDSSLLCSLNDSVVFIVSPNCRQAERLGLDDPSYLHGIFVSSHPNVYAPKSGSHQTLKQIIDCINKTIAPPVINKSDPRQMKKLLALEESLSTIDMLSKPKVSTSTQQEAVESAVTSFTSSDLIESEAKIPEPADTPATNSIQPIKPINNSEPITANNYKGQDDDLVKDPSVAVSIPEKDTSDANQMTEIEHRLEQDIIKLKLSLRTLCMPFMKNSIKSADAHASMDVDDAKTDDGEETTTADNKVMECCTHGDENINKDDKSDGLECYDENDDDPSMDHDDEDYDDDNGMKENQEEDDDDDDVMDDDLADQIVLKCLQPSFMSPHIKLDSLGHVQGGKAEQGTKMNVDVQIIEDDLLTPTSRGCTPYCDVILKNESDVKSEPEQQDYEQDDGKKHEDSLESGEIISSTETSFVERIGSQDEFYKEEIFVISDDDTDNGSSVIVLEHLSVIPWDRKLDQKPKSECESPSIVYEYGNDGQVLYRNIKVTVLKNVRTLEIKEDELCDSYPEDSTLDENVLLEVFGKNQLHLQQAKYKSTYSNSEDKLIDESSCLESKMTSDLTQRKFVIGPQSQNLRMRMLDDLHYSTSVRVKDGNQKPWEDFLMMFLKDSSSDLEENHTTAFQQDLKLSKTFETNSMPRFYRPLYVYRASFEEILETFGTLSKEDQDDEEPVYCNDEIMFYNERKKCASFMDELVLEKSSIVKAKGEAGVCNLRWFQCLNKESRSKVKMNPLRKAHDDFVASHFFLTSTEDELSRSGIPFLEDVKEGSPDSFQEDEGFMFTQFREAKQFAWPNELLVVDAPQRRPPIQQKVFKMTPRVISIEIHTYEDPRLSSTLPSDSIYQPFLVGDCDDNDCELELLPEDKGSVGNDPENLIVTLHLRPNILCSLSQSTDYTNSKFNTGITPYGFEFGSAPPKSGNIKDNLMENPFPPALDQYKWISTETETKQFLCVSSKNESKKCESIDKDCGVKPWTSDACHVDSEIRSAEALISGDVSSSLLSSSVIGFNVQEEPLEYIKRNMKDDQNYSAQELQSAYESSEKNNPLGSITGMTNKRSFVENECAKHKKMKLAEGSGNSFVGNFSYRRNVFCNKTKVSNLKSKFCRLFLRNNFHKSKNLAKFNQVCKSCNKFFINKYLRCHRSISLHCKDNKDGFLINAILSLMCFKHLQRKCPHDPKKSSKFFGYFKDVPLNRKISPSKNYIQLEKTVGNVAKHVQKCNKLHHSMFLSALALNYHSQNFKKSIEKVSSNQSKRGSKNVDLIVQSCLKNVRYEMDMMLDEMTCATHDEYTGMLVAEHTNYEKQTSKNHFLNLSHFCKDLKLLKTSLENKFPAELDSHLIRNTLETQEKVGISQDQNKDQKCENTWKQIKINLHARASPKSKANKPQKSVKLTATGGKLVHSRSNPLYMPDFHKIRSKPASGSPLCKVSSSDEVLSGSFESTPSGSCQDPIVCSTSPEILNEKVSELRHDVLNGDHKAEYTIEEKTAIRNIQREITPDVTIFHKSKERHVLTEPVNQYAVYNFGDPFHNQQAVYHPSTPATQYPWNNMILTFQSPPPIMGMTYPMPPPFSICNNFIATNIIRPLHQVTGFVHVPPSFYHKAPPPIARPLVQHVFLPTRDMKTDNKQTNLHPRSNQELLNNHNKRIYVFNKDRSLSHSIERFLQFKGALTFDPFNILMLRNVPNIQCFVLVYFQDLHKLDKIPNVLQLKKDLRVQFVIYKNVQDVKFQKFELIFPKGGMLIIEEETFLALDADTFQNMCESLKKQMVENFKPWRLILSETIKTTLGSPIRSGSNVTQVQHWEGLSNALKNYESAGLVSFFAGPSIIVRPKRTKDYLENCLNLQSTCCFQFRHFLFLTDKNVSKEDSLKFTSHGVDILTISAFARGFLSMVIKSSKISNLDKLEALDQAKYCDANLSSVAKPCALLL